MKKTFSLYLDTELIDDVRNTLGTDETISEKVESLIRTGLNSELPNVKECIRLLANSYKKERPDLFSK